MATATVEVGHRVHSDARIARGATLTIVTVGLRAVGIPSVSSAPRGGGGWFSRCQPELSWGRESRGFVTTEESRPGSH